MFTTLRNSCLINFKKIQKQPPGKFCKKLILKISQYSQENTCVEDAFQFRILRNFLEQLGAATSENVHETEKK